MKKIAALAVVFSMIVIFAGCRNNNSSYSWTPFKKDQTVCYSPVNSCDIPVVDDCCPCDSGCGTIGTVSSGCSSCAMGATTVQSTSVPMVEPIPGN